MRPIHSRITYANVVSTIALFLALAGGAAFAASQLGKNSVGSKQLKKNAVVTAKIKKEAVTGAKVKKDTLTGKQINEEKLGAVPLANAIPPAEAIHLIGAPGEPAFENGSGNYPGEGPLKFHQAGFYKDHEGIVHLEGLVKPGKAPPGTIPSIFTLPAGFRPTAGSLAVFPQLEEKFILIGGANTTAEAFDLSGKIFGLEELKTVVLDGITFRAGG